MMNSRIKILGVIGGCLLLAVFLMYQILYSGTGGLALLIAYLGVAAVIASVINPKTGLYLTAFSTVYLEVGKRFAVYFGETSMMTVMQVLGVSMACLGGTYLGIFIQTAIFRSLKIERWQVLLFALGGGVSMVLLFLNRDFGVPSAVQVAVNGGLYLGLIPAVALLLPTKEDCLRFLSFIFWILLPSPLWALRQFFYGFTDMEWQYALSGLSPVTTNFVQISLRMGAAPDPTGLASNTAAYQIIMLCVPFGLWHAWHFRKNRLLYFLAGLMFSIGCLISGHRTVLVYPLLVFAFFWFCLRPSRTVAAYVLGIGIFLTGVVFADTLDRNIEQMSEFTSSLLPGRLGQTLSLNTFSDRLKGWHRFTQAESYSLLGRSNSEGPETTAEAEQESNHDLINKILIDLGVVGLIGFAALAFVLLRSVHSLVYQTTDPKGKSEVAMMLACVLPAIFLSFIGGGNLATNPHNLVYWSFIGGAVTLSRIKKEETSPELVDEGEEAELSGKLGQRMALRHH